MRLIKFKPSLHKFDKFNHLKTIDSKKKILFASSVGQNSDFYLSSILGKLFINKGHSVQFLICDKVLKGCFNCKYNNFSNDYLRNQIASKGPGKWCNTCFSWGKKILDSGNLDSIRYSNNFDQSIIDDLKKKLNKINKLNHLKTFKYKNFNIGLHSYAAVVRFYATPDIEDEVGVINVFKSYLISAATTIEVLSNIEKKNKFDLIFVDHGIYIPQGVIIEFFSKLRKKIFTYAAGYRNKTFIFTKNNSYHYEMLKFIDLNKYNISNDQLLRVNNYLQNRKIGKQDWISFHESNHLNNLPKINNKLVNISLFTNVLWDAKIHFKKSIYEDCEKWIFDTLSFISKKKLNNIHIFIRVHPGELKGFVKSRKFIEKNIQKYLKEKKINNATIISANSSVNSYSLAESTDYSIVYGSKIGIELPALGVKTIVVGDCWTKNKDITCDPKSKFEYHTILEQINNNKFNFNYSKTNALKFMYYVFYDCMKEFSFLKKTKGNPPFKIDFDQLNNDTTLNQAYKYFSN